MSTNAEEHVKNLEEEVSKLKDEIEAIKQGDFEGDENLDKMLTENSKLKHRLAILNRVSLVFLLD